MNNLNHADPGKLEHKHVHEVYDAIADHFGHTRYKPWPKVAAFLRKHSTGIVLDFGCGNAKYSQSSAPQAFWVGSDRSVELLNTARQFTKQDSNILFMKKAELRCAMRPVELVRADIMNSCFRSEIADVVMAIAVLHHISSRERRVHAIQQMIGCTKPGGKVLIYVWSKKQETGSIGAREFDNIDCLVPWNNTKTGETLMRYYHVFDEEEILEECRLAGSQLGVQIVDYSNDCNNLVVILEKQVVV